MPILSAKTPLSIGPFVRETGDVMSGDLEMNGNDFLTIGHITFDLAHVSDLDVGVLQWNNTDGTLEVGALGGQVVLQMGQESHVRAVNKTGGDLADGVVVTLVGAQGSRPKVVLSDADSPTANSATGLTTEPILNNQEGYVTTFGFVRGLDTSVCVEGDRLWLTTTPGVWSNTPPTAPSRKVFIGICIVSNINNGVIFVDPVNIPTIVALSDVFPDDLAAGTVLYWNAANLRFEFDSVLTLSDTLAAINGDLVVGGTSKQTNATYLQIESGLTAKEDAGAPTADTGYWKLWSLADNKLYFQDGDGADHEIALV